MAWLQVERAEDGSAFKPTPKSAPIPQPASTLPDSGPSSLLNSASTLPDSGPSTLLDSASTLPDSASTPTLTPEPALTSTPASTPAPAPAPAPAPTLPARPSGASTTQSHDSTSSSRTVPIGVLIGAVLAAVVLSTGGALFVCYFRVLRRRRIARVAQPMTASTGNGVPPPLLLPSQAIGPYFFFNADSMRENMASVEFIAAMQQHGIIANGGQLNLAAVPPPTPQRSMEPVSGQMGNGKTGRRAVDAGPVANDSEDEDDVESTLPPGYRDVFTTSTSPTVSSRS